VFRDGWSSTEDRFLVHQRTGSSVGNSSFSFTCATQQAISPILINFRQLLSVGHWVETRSRLSLLLIVHSFTSIASSNLSWIFFFKLLQPQQQKKKNKTTAATVTTIAATTTTTTTHTVDSVFSENLTKKKCKILSNSFFCSRWISDAGKKTSTDLIIFRKSVRLFKCS